MCLKVPCPSPPPGPQVQSRRFNQHNLHLCNNISLGYNTSPHRLYHPFPHPHPHRPRSRHQHHRLLFTRRSSQLTIAKAAVEAGVNAKRFAPAELGPDTSSEISVCSRNHQGQVRRSGWAGSTEVAIQGHSLGLARSKDFLSHHDGISIPTIPS